MVDRRHLQLLQMHHRAATAFEQHPIFARAILLHAGLCCCCCCKKHKDSMAAAAKREAHVEEVLRQIVSCFLVDSMETGDILRAVNLALKGKPVAWLWPSMLCVRAVVRLLHVLSGRACCIIALKWISDAGTFCGQEFNILEGFYNMVTQNMGPLQRCV